MTMSGQYYPPPPGTAVSAGQQQQKSYPMPPTSPPANQTKFYPPPPGTPSFAPPSAQHYPSPPPQQQQSYNPPPQQSYQSPPQQSYPPPPQQSGTPQPPSTSSTPVSYPPPPQAGHAPQHQHHMSLPMRDGNGMTPPPGKPPGYDGPSEGGYPQEKTHSTQASMDLSRRASAMSSQQAPQQQPAAVNMHAGAPPPGQFQGAQSTAGDDVGQFNGGSYRISHRDSNSIITLQLAMGCPLDAKPGVLIAMSPTVTLKGEYKFNLKRMIAGGEIGHSTFIGPGEVLFAPGMLGDMTTIRLHGDESWSVGKDAYVASTQGIVKDYKRQGLGKAMFSGEGLWVYKMTGVGLLWITSFGAIIRKDLTDGEKYIVDNGHLVAWNTKYIMERVASGGIMAGFASGEGLVCKFTGPGTVFLQTRNPRAFSAYMTGNAAPP
ncbi:hypothetical protein PG995_006908 [Apiospora arundinis]